MDIKNKKSNKSVVDDYSTDYPELSDKVDKTINEIAHYGEGQPEQIEAPEDHEKLPDILAVPEISKPNN